MKPALKLIAVLMLAALGAGAWYGAQSQGRPSPPNSKSTPTAQSDSRETEPTQSEVTIPEGTVQESAGFAPDLSRFVTVAPSWQEFKRLGGERRLLAANAREAQWLARHGYPTNAELVAAFSDPIEAVEARAQSGNPAAMAVYARRLERDGRCATTKQADICAQWYARAIDDGSLYAMDRFAKIAGFHDGQLEPTELARINAHAILAEMLGSTDSAWVLIGRNADGSPRRATEIERQSAQGEVAGLLSAINDRRRSRGLEPLSPDARPLRTPEEAELFAMATPSDPVLSWPRR